MTKITAKRTKADDPMVIQHEDGTASIYFDLAQGSVVPRNDFSSPTWDTNSQWEDNPSDAQGKIKKAVEWYTNDPIVNKSISLLAQLANDSFRISSEDQDTENFFIQWWKDIGGSDFLSWFFLEYFRSGNVPIFKTLIPYVPKKYDPDAPPSTASEVSKISKRSTKARDDYYRAMKTYDAAIKSYNKGQASKRIVNNAERALAAAQKTWVKNSIPGAYTILNPLSIEIVGPDDLPWLRVPRLVINDDIKKAVQSPSKELKDVVSAIPQEVVKEIKKGVDKVILPEYLCSIITREKQPYETWALPLCAPAFDALAYKQELRTMDKHTVRGVRNRILKVTIGNDEYPVLDTKSLKQLAKEFNNPSRNLTIFWNHTLGIEYIEPNLESLNIEKYEPVLEEIRTCFGIAKVLTGNDGTSLGNSVVNLKGLVEVLAEAQKAFLSWFHQEATRISEAISLPKVPEAYFGQLNLKDENEYIRVLATLVDRQILSYETMVNTIGFHFPKELDRLKQEKVIRETDGVLVPQKAPTQMSPTGNEGRPDGTPEGDRKEREGKTRMPGDTSASILHKMADYKKQIKNSMEEHYNEAHTSLKAEGKRMTSSRADAIKMEALQEAVLTICRNNGFNDDILVMSVAAAKSASGNNKEAMLDNVIDFASFYMTHENSE